MEASPTFNNTEANTEQLVQDLMMRSEIAHAESITAHPISKDVDVLARGTNIPSHGTLLYPDTVMKNGTENLVRDDTIDETIVEAKIHNAETVAEI